MAEATMVPVAASFVVQQSQSFRTRIKSAPLRYLNTEQAIVKTENKIWALLSYLEKHGSEYSDGSQDEAERHISKAQRALNKEKEKFRHLDEPRSLWQRFQTDHYEVQMMEARANHIHATLTALSAEHMERVNARARAEERRRASESIMVEPAQNQTFSQRSSSVSQDVKVVLNRHTKKPIQCPAIHRQSSGFAILSFLNSWLLELDSKVLNLARPTPQCEAWDVWEGGKLDYEGPEQVRWVYELLHAFAPWDPLDTHLRRRAHYPAELKMADSFRRLMRYRDPRWLLMSKSEVMGYASVIESVGW